MSAAQDATRLVMQAHEQLPATIDDGLSVERVGARLDKIQQLQREKMDKGTDFGVIPGTKNPTLLKPGAEKLCVLFQLDAQPETTEIFHPDGHLTVKCRMVIYHQVSGQRLGAAAALCSSRESRYAYRKGERVCPQCGKATIFKSKPPRTGWYCWMKRDGCGANFAVGDAAIEGQQVGRVPNADIGDTFNTIMRVAEKRALVAAVRLVTGASAIFDEEMPAGERDDADNGHKELSEEELQAHFDQAEAETRQKAAEASQDNPSAEIPPESERPAERAGSGNRGISEKQVNLFYAKARAAGLSDADGVDQAKLWLKNAYGLEEPEEIPSRSFDQVLARLGEMFQQKPKGARR